MNNKTSEVNKLIVQLKDGGMLYADIARVIRDTYNIPLTSNAIGKRYRNIKQSVDVPDSQEVHVLDVEDTVTESDIHNFTKGIVESPDIPAGYIVKSVSVNERNGTHSFWVKYARQSPAEMDSQQFIAMLDSIEPLPVSTRKKAQESNVELAVVSIMDAHIGKVDNFDPDATLYTQMQDYRRIIDEIVDKVSSKSPKKIVIPFGNDWLHADNLKNQTTAGTQMQLSRPMDEVIYQGLSLGSYLIERMYAYNPQAEIDVDIVNGNHDDISCTWMGFYFKKAYRDHGGLNINMTKLPYITNGANKVALLFSHGELKPELLLSSWASNENLYDKKTKEIIVGHRHTRKETLMMVDERHGVLYRTCPSLSSSDVWHTKNLYTGNDKAAQIMYYDDQYLIADEFVR